MNGRRSIPCEHNNRGGTWAYVTRTELVEALKNTLFRNAQNKMDELDRESSNSSTYKGGSEGQCIKRIYGGNNSKHLDAVVAMDVWLVWRRESGADVPRTCP